MKNEGSIQLFPTRVFDLYGCPHVGFIQFWSLIWRGIVLVLSEFNFLKGIPVTSGYLKHKASRCLSLDNVWRDDLRHSSWSFAELRCICGTLRLQNKDTNGSCEGKMSIVWERLYFCWWPVDKDATRRGLIRSTKRSYTITFACRCLFILQSTESEKDDAPKYDSIVNEEDSSLVQVCNPS